MNNYIIVFLILLILLYSNKRKNKINIYTKIKRQRGNYSNMEELAKRFIDKKCYIYTINDQVTGVIKEVCDKSILLETTIGLEAINIDFVIRIKEIKSKKSK